METGRIGAERAARPQVAPGNVIGGGPEAPLASPDDNVPVINVVQGLVLRPVRNGYVVQIGCMEFVATTLDEVFQGYKAYLANPRAEEEKWRNYIPK